MRSRPVAAGARLAVELAARLLPTPAARRRYQAEFVAELCGRPRVEQWRHATGVLSHVFALRAVLSGREAAATVPLGRRFRCRVLRWHHWRTCSAPDGGRYLACSVCAKEHPAASHWLAGSAAGGLGGGGAGVA